MKFVGVWVSGLESGYSGIQTAKNSKMDFSCSCKGCFVFIFEIYNAQANVSLYSFTGSITFCTNCKNARLASPNTQVVQIVNHEEGVSITGLVRISTSQRIVIMSTIVSMTYNLGRIHAAKCSSLTTL